MSKINPWVEIYRNTSGSTIVNYDWQAGKEYLFYFSDRKGTKEMNFGHMMIMEDIPVPVSGTAGVKIASGWDCSVLAEITTSGTKRFQCVWGGTIGTGDEFYCILERDIDPSASGAWSLHPQDDTTTFEEILSTSARSGSFTQFDQDYEYLLWLWAPENSQTHFYAACSYFNLSTMYQYPRSQYWDSRMLLYWYHQDWIRFNGRSTTGTFESKNGVSTHRVRKLYRRRIETDPSKGYYNTIKTIVTHGRETSNFRRALTDKAEYIYGMVDDTGGDELVFGHMRPDATLDRVDGTSGMLVNRCGEDARLMYTQSQLRLDFNGGAGYVLHERVLSDEHDSNPIDPDPDPEPNPDPTVNCQDVCVWLGEDYVADVFVEVQFNGPPDWQIRNYAYEWHTDNPELSVINTESDGRIAVMRLVHTMGELDDRADKVYNVSVSVSDLDYALAGVASSASADITFELPCLGTDSESVFSVNDIIVDECGPGDVDTVATFRISVDAPVEGRDRTIDFAVEGITASSIAGTISTLMSDSSDKAALVVQDTGASKLVLETCFGRLWNMYAGTNGATNAYCQILANIATWTYTGDFPQKVLVIEDTSPSFPVAGTDAHSFEQTLDTAFETILTGWTYETQTVSSVSSQNQTYFEGFSLILYIATAQVTNEDQSNLMSDSNAMIGSMISAFRNGVGLMVCSDHNVYQRNANKIVAKITPALQFKGGSGVDRLGQGFTADGAILKHGSHPILDITNKAGAIASLASEAYIDNITDSEDFVIGSGTLTFTEGQEYADVPITVRCDDMLEIDETFKLVLSNPSIGTISKAEGIATITDSSLNTTQVELAVPGESTDVYVYRDISGSMGGTDITLNGVPNSRRDDLVVQILNDFSIPVDKVYSMSGGAISTLVSFINHALNLVPTTQNKVSILVITDAVDGYSSSSRVHLHYDTPDNDHPKMIAHGDVAATTTNTVPEATYIETQQGNTWSDVIPSIPAHLNDIKITAVRVLGSVEQGTANAVETETAMNLIFDTAPPQVTQASFETFDSYTTGDNTVLNDRISEAVLAIWEGYCARDRSTVVQVQSGSEEGAIALASATLGCPDD